ncbi:MAG: hypothetical protein IJ695_05435 [Butyrivibrio sp.]|nr:hypothetical protein [Butyrivibrio sp.]
MEASVRKDEILAKQSKRANMTGKKRWRQWKSTGISSKTRPNGEVDWKKRGMAVEVNGNF